MLTIELIKASISGTEIIADERSFMSVWTNIIEGMRRQDRVGTAENYQWALNSFRNIVGDVPGFNIDLNVMRKWDKGMREGVIRNGETVGKIADATRGMYLRTCRVVWNRSNGMSIVIVPVIEPLLVILDAIGAKPENGQRVFPQIFSGATDELTMRKLTVQENSNIKDRVIRVCKDVLDWRK